MEDYLFSIIIPARDEEVELPKCLTAIQNAAARITENIEIIVVLNRCTDGTESIAKTFGCKTVTEDTKNLSVIRNAGVKAATGKIIITVDADSRMSENMLVQIKRTLLSGRFIGGGVMMYTERISLGILLSALLLAPFVFYKGFISAGLFYCFREDFWKIGGFNERLVTLEDVDFARRLKSYGKSIGKRYSTLFSAHIITSCRKFDRFGDWYFIRNPSLILRLLRGTDVEAGNKIWYDFKRK